MTYRNKEFHNNLLSRNISIVDNLYSSLNEDDFDIYFKLDDGRQIGAHKCILVSRSSYLLKIFSYDPNMKEMLIPNVSFDALQNVLKFIYTDKEILPFELSLLDEILQLAKKFQLPLLEHYVLRKFKMPSSLNGLPTIWEDLKKMLFSPLFSDIVIIVDNIPFHAHKVILTARCFYFKSLLKGKWKESSQDQIVIQDIDVATFSNVMKYLYCNIASIECSNDALELHRLAQFFGIDSLILTCENYIFSRGVNVETVCSIWNCAKEIKAEHLFERCQKFFIENFMDCCDESDYLDLDRDLFKLALTAGEIDADSRKMINIISKWAKHNALKLEISEDELLSGLLPPQTLFNQKIKYALLQSKSFSPLDLFYL